MPSAGPASPSAPESPDCLGSFLRDSAFIRAALFSDQNKPRPDPELRLWRLARLEGRSTGRRAGHVFVECMSPKNRPAVTGPLLRQGSAACWFFRRLTR